jgi:hypothetical protein
MEDSGFTVDAVTAAIAGNKEGFVNAFNSAIASKVTDALEVKKVEVASNLLGQEEVTNEIEGSETEVDGSSDAAVDSTEE